MKPVQTRVSRRIKMEKKENPVIPVHDAIWHLLQGGKLQYRETGKKKWNDLPAGGNQLAYFAKYDFRAKAQ